MSLFTLQDVTVAYQKQAILQDFNLSIGEGELVSLLGPSGCGKTTTLRLIAGFLQSKQGKFLFREKDYTKVPVNKRNFGFVFQNYALFPHMTVFDNVAFGLRQRKVSKASIKDRVLRVLDIVSLKGFEERFPAALSGGQKQRVAIARALVIEPDLLLFDEPLSNLDANLRVNMRVEIRRIQQELGITTVYVSHDQEECFSISDKVAIMNKGIIEQLSDPATIYRQPKTKFVADFIGFKNFIQFDSRRQESDGIAATVQGITLTVQQQDNVTGLVGAIRPDDLRLYPLDAAPMTVENAVQGKVLISTYLGRSYQYEVQTSIGQFTVNDDAAAAPLANGQEVVLEIPKKQIVLVD
ncbi:ABC transporter ATP-binding protein [Terribacillus saccharophilus]|uniref:ABC transporter ATP-binding protein n=1 Tax=Terribacillus saccharophilus TaxID=361277 RepID=UPI0037F87ED2